MKKKGSASQFSQSKSFLLLKEASSARNHYRGSRCMPKRKKKSLGKKGKNKGEYILVDRISELPDEILFSIVSLLPLKEAAATSVLSKRWQYVWTSTTTLNFDAKFEVHENLWRFFQMKPELKDLETRRYIDWVNTVVEQHRGPAIERFRVCSSINSRFTSSIDKWIHYAMSRRVQILELVFRFDFVTPYTELYQFPHKILGLKNDSTSRLKHMHSDIPSLHSRGYNVGFKFLKVLHFQYVDVTGEVLEYFLSTCQVLERLTVNSAMNLVKLRVVGPLIALKYLDIQWCGVLESIEIHDATNLVSFIYQGHAIKLLLSNVPLLVEVSISEDLVASFYNEGHFYFKSIELPFSQLSSCLSQLAVLMLDIEGAIYDENRVFPVLANLKHLELIVTANNRRALCHLNSFMKASPCLRRLVLKLGFSSLKGAGKKWRVGKCPHPNLKVAEIVGYRAEICVVEHVMYLIKNAIALEKLVIDPVRRWEYPSELYPSEKDRGVKQVKEEVEARDHAMQQLKGKVASTIEFVCL
ncbi:PREDICTED: F-box/FBD/LRR-repeat protein At5g22700-like isoform X2 [Prunus mume]|uniref:F-box/FBD/LRR-repeat protein At5g22700-like isoform X2 n=1 Tax=Prunus mume TaxID=102107 RepID=A0ABM0NNH3_PRUMU|nr:PREDICTED: F-box/FBD/LRR-repeat protein At5g22700-like isoform X2 [Prunus mume]